MADFLSGHCDSTVTYEIQVGNKLHGQRFRLTESVKKLQDCMNNLEKERAGRSMTLSSPAFWTTIAPSSR